MDETKRPLPPVYFYAGLAAMIGLHVLFPIVRFYRYVDPVVRYAGLAPILAGVALNLWADGLFKKAGTEVKPFRESSSLVTDGPFRMSRNPMYLGGLLIFIGTAVLLGSLMAVLVIPPMMALVHVHFIVPEERDMARQFGAEYDAYRRRVRRWL